MTLEFEINSKPIPQARPRFFVRQCGFRRIVDAYDPAGCRNFKETVAWTARPAVREKVIKEPVDEPIAMKVIFMMGENSRERFHTKKPGIDNLAKSVKDALKGIVYKDDCQIVESHLYKIFGGPKILVHLEVLDA